MKQFMKKCYKCSANVKSFTTIKRGISLNCMKCLKCGEEYFVSSELKKFDKLNQSLPLK